MLIRGRVNEENVLVNVYCVCGRVRACVSAYFVYSYTCGMYIVTRFYTCARACSKHWQPTKSSKRVCPKAVAVAVAAAGGPSNLPGGACIVMTARRLCSWPGSTDGYARIVIDDAFSYFPSSSTLFYTIRGLLPCRRLLQMYVIRAFLRPPPSHTSIYYHRHLHRHRARILSISGHERFVSCVSATSSSPRITSSSL